MTHGLLQRLVSDSTGSLTITISRGVGSGRTRLAAFDAALRDAGVADFNLIRLSSVIPPGATVREVEAAEQIRGGHGDALFCVYADAYASTPHAEAWAGVAWSTHDDGTGAGLFVEHSGLSEDSVQRDLEMSIEDLSAGRGGGFAWAGSTLASARCTDRTVCALVIASYRAVPIADL